MSPLTPTRDGRQRGAVILYVAFFLVLMLGFISLSVDLTKLMVTRTQLQNAADGAALAGASAIDPDLGAIVPDTAIVRAQQTSRRNRAFVEGAEPVELAVADIEFPTPKQVKVTVRRTGGTSLITYLARVLGIDSLQISATATAEADTAAALCDGLVPMAPIL